MYAPGNKNKEEEQLLLGMRPKEAESYLARKKKAENSKHMKKRDSKIDFDPSFFRFQSLLDHKKVSLLLVSWFMPDFLFH
jgi:hypothetical protein